MEAPYDTLRVEREADGLVWCTLDRPEALNAMSPELVDELHAFLDAMHEDREARVVVLRGAGRAFCAGLDLKAGGGEGAGRGVTAGMRSQHHIAELVIKLRRIPQPVIALVHGAACGGGLSLAVASDIRIAGESLRMNAAYIRIGLGGCDVGSSYFLPRLVGASVAAEMILTGNFIDAERALATGLVSKVVADDALEAAGREMARDILRNSPIGVRLSKECLNFSIDAPSLESAVAMEDRNQILAAQTKDMREGVKAFFEKRPPVYEGD